MKNNLHRVFSSLLEISQLKLGLDLTGSKQSILFASRLISSSGYQQHQHEIPKSTEEKKEEEEQEEEAESSGDLESDMEVVDGELVNKKTGEIGGTRGPEPTRFGDWERNGRCSDF